MVFKSMLDNPLGPVREMDRLFDSMIAAPAIGLMPSFATPSAAPAINLREDEDRLIAEAELPGMKMDDIEIFASGDELTIKGSRATADPEHARVLRRERPSGAFARTIRLPVTIDVEHVEATLADGVLTISLPKIPEAQPRRIEVRGS